MLEALNQGKPSRAGRVRRLAGGNPVRTQKRSFEMVQCEAPLGLGARRLADLPSLGAVAQQKDELFEDVALAGADEAGFAMMDEGTDRKSVV